MIERRRRFAVVVALFLAILWSVAYDAVRNQTSVTTKSQDVETTSEERVPNTVLAIEALQSLAVKGRAPRTGYSREQFGGDWAITLGCDTRNLILQRDLENVKLAEDNCAVLSGQLQEDPYTGATILFKRGPSTSQAIQIDHVVAVSDAWQKGAQNITLLQREIFYNDSLNLLAVDGPTNIKKGDADAATWLPPNKSYRCRYVARQVAVKVKYKFWVTPAERDAIKRVLGTCPNQVLPIETPSSLTPKLLNR